MDPKDVIEHLTVKPVRWLGSSRKDLRELPKSVRRKFGQAIFDAQTGETNPATKSLKGFGGGGVLEVVEDDNGNAYRAVYTIRFREVVFVLHVFQKKSKVGRKTDQKDIDLIVSRLKAAERIYADEFKNKK